MAWLRKLLSQPQPRPVTAPTLSVATNDSASNVVSLSSGSKDSANNAVAGVQTSSASKASPINVAKRTSRPVASCPDVADVRVTSDDRCSSMLGGVDSCDEDATDGSVVYTTCSPYSALVGKSISMSRISLSSVDDDINVHEHHQRFIRKMSLTSSSSLPGHISDWPLLTDNDRLISWPTSTEASSMVLLPQVGQRIDGSTSNSAAATNKSTFKKNPNKSRKRRVTTEIRMTDISQATVEIGLSEPSSPMSDGRKGPRNALRYAGSMKDRPARRADAAKGNSFKVKDITVKLSALLLPFSSGDNKFDIYGRIDELEENIEFELQYVQQLSGRVRSADHLDTINDRFSDPGLGSGLNCSMKDIAVIRPAAAISKRSRDMLNGLYASDNISSIRMERQYLCHWRGSVRLFHLKDRLSHSRYMFLFNNHLLIAKHRYNARMFTLKNKIRLIDIWLSNYGSSDVTGDVADFQDKSFVIGWPTVNYVATFQTSDEKRTCFERLQKMCNDRRVEQPAKDVLKIVRKDQQLTVTKALSVNLDETADRILQRCMSEFHFNEADAKDYHLVVQLSRDTVLVPLNGYERPLSIVKSQQQAIFYLVLRDKEALKPVNRRSKSPRVGLFKKSQNSHATSGETRRSKIASPSSSGKLFGRNIELICVNGTVVKPVMDLMQLLYDRGPFTVGIFRTAPRYGETRSLRERLDAGNSDVGELSTHAAASSLKELLRALPDSLLVCAWYSRWIDIVREQDLQSRRNLIKIQTLRLPTANSLLLRHLLSILCRIVRHADENKMTSSNLATCIAPSLLWDATNSNGESVNAVISSQSVVIQLVEHLIVHAPDIWKDPADCIELLQPRKMLSAHSAVSSLSVQTASSSGSLSDSEDSSPKVILDFDVDLSRDVMEDQLSPASRDSGLAMGGSYRYSNEELATASGTNSSDYEADMMSSSVNGDLSKSDNNVATSDGQQLMRLPDILEGQTINRLDSGYPNSSSSSVSGVVSRKTGTVRERIHTTKIMKTSSDDSAICRSSTGDERTSVFDEAFDDEVDDQSMLIPVGNTSRTTEAKLSSRGEELLADVNDNEMHSKANRKSYDTSRSFDSQVQAPTPSKFEHCGRKSPSGIDTLFNNLNSIHKQKYGSVNKLLVFEDSCSTSSSGEPIVGAPVEEDLVCQKTLAKMTESSKLMDQQRFDETTVAPAGQAQAGNLGKKQQLIALHKMSNRNVQPALATPEIWPTSSRHPLLSGQHSLDAIEVPQKMKTAERMTARSKVVESEPQTKSLTVAPVTGTHSSVVISLQPGRDLIRQVNQPQANRREQDAASMKSGSNGDRRQPVKNVQDPSSWQSDHNSKPFVSYSVDDCSSDSSVNSSSMPSEQNQLAKQNGVLGGKRATAVVGNRDESFNSQGGTVRMLPNAGGRAQQPQHRPTQSTVVTVTDQCAIIERRQNTSKSAVNSRLQSEQPRPDRADSTRQESRESNATSTNASFWQQQHQRPAVGKSVVPSGRPVTVSAQLIRGQSGGMREQNEAIPPRNVNDHRVTSAGHGDELPTSNVAKLRSVYVVGQR